MANPWNEDEPYDYSGVWLGCLSVQRHTNWKVSGDPDVDWFAHALREVDLGDPAARCVMLGASEGHRVHQLCEAGFTGEVVATDMGGHFPFERANLDPEVDLFLRLLLAVEDAVIDAELLDDDFVYYELRRR